MDIRAFSEADRAECEVLLASRDLAGAISDHFFVLEHEDKILGCGGFTGDRLESLAVRLEFENQGLGRFLLMYLLKNIGTPLVHAHAPLAFAGFFETQGFRRTIQSPTHVFLTKKLTVCN